MARRIPRKISKSYLENAALHYLQRYATSSANLRRVLLRKVERSCRHHGEQAEDFLPEVDNLLKRYLSAGLLDDKAYAIAKTTSLRRKGKSRQAIQAKLRERGLETADIGAALNIVDDEDTDAELHAALALAKKKKLGPFRTRPARDPQEARKDMAALGRAGFSYEIARQALSFKEEDVE